MKLRLLITSVVVAAAMLLPSAATATSDDDRGRFLSLPPDLTTAYLQGHFPHRDPRHPHAKYRHRKLATADNRGVDRFNGELETLADRLTRPRREGVEPDGQPEIGGR